MLLLIADITERRQADRALRKAHDELRLNAEHIQTLIDNIYDLILIISDAGRLLEVMQNKGEHDTTA
ncbi:MAG TPA: hypothetical protein VJG32_04295 [Anaerolineae bacterium]|nr:hypothetical protein [Anaerolineae bacterium]